MTVRGDRVNDVFFLVGVYFWGVFLVGDVFVDFARRPDGAVAL